MSSPLGGLPGPPITDVRDPYHFLAVWAAWFNIAHTILTDASNSGTTAQRPITVLYTGKTYFDTTLGKPIWFKGGGVWVDATGAPV